MESTSFGCVPKACRLITSRLLLGTRLSPTRPTEEPSTGLNHHQPLGWLTTFSVPSSFNEHLMPVQEY
jgi:hypothetical protein